jgi:hypothetical protein
MDSAMAIIAKGDQILGYIFTQRTSPADVVNLEKPWASAALTPPPIPLKNLAAKVSVGMRIQAQPSPSRRSMVHNSHCVRWENSAFCGSGSSEYNRVSARSNDSDLPLSICAPARKSAQIISRQ